MIFIWRLVQYYLPLCLIKLPKLQVTDRFIVDDKILISAHSSPWIILSAIINYRAFGHTQNYRYRSSHNFRVKGLLLIISNNLLIVNSGVTRVFLESLISGIFVAFSSEQHFFQRNFKDSKFSRKRLETSSSRTKWQKIDNKPLKETESFKNNVSAFFSL